MKQTSSKASSAQPTPEQIGTRAEVLWRARGGPKGRDDEIWLEAERQLIEENREILDDEDGSAKTSASGRGETSSRSR